MHCAVSEMESASVIQFLEAKTILVTGATGFLAKVFLEKVLRVQPNIEKLFLLLRADDETSAKTRFENEIIGKDLFRVLKEKCGASFGYLISQKVTIIAGDITSHDMGINDANLRERVSHETEIIINLAATTRFDERYDYAFGINTLGPKNIMDFAKRCISLKLVIHVSTAYVCGEKGGLIKETPYKMGETLKGDPSLDIHAKKVLIDEKLRKLMAEGATDKEISTVMRDFGIERANKHGWPNTYVFTKTMGEMMIGESKDHLPLLIIRPTIITGTYHEPFPGWIEGVRTIDVVALGYGKGKINYFLGDKSVVIDLIPADMVVNFILVSAAMAQAHRPPHGIYLIGSSLRNPLSYTVISDNFHRYFTEHPLMDKRGKPIKVVKSKSVSSITRFNIYIAVRYLPLLKGLQFANAALCQLFKGTHDDMRRKIKLGLRLAMLYKPYLLFKGIFDDTNMEELQILAREKGLEMEESFYIDPRKIDWEDYFQRVHLPGVVKYLL